MYDEKGNPIMEKIEVDDYDSPIIVKEEVINPETGEKEIIFVQKHHTARGVLRKTAISLGQLYIMTVPFPSL